LDPGESWEGCKKGGWNKRKLEKYRAAFSFKALTTPLRKGEPGKDSEKQDHQEGIFLGRMIIPGRVREREKFRTVGECVVLYNKTRLGESSSGAWNKKKNKNMGRGREMRKRYGVGGISVR